MPEQTEDIGEARILREGKFGGDDQEDSDDEIIEDLPVKCRPVPVEKDHRNNQEKADDILAHDLKRRKTGTGNIGDRKIVEDENRGNDKDVCGQVHDCDEVKTDVPADEEGGGKERNRLEVAGSYPEPGRECTASIGEYADTLVHESVEEVEDGDEHESDTDKQEVVIVNDFTGLPDEQEDRDRDGDSDEFNRRMVEREVIQADQPEEDGDKDHENKQDKEFG